MRGAPPKSDYLIAPACEAVLVLTVCLLGWATKQPLIFASLGPTAYEMVEQPRSKTAKPYNVVIGHLVGVLSGFAALALVHGFGAPGVTFLKSVPFARVWASVIGTALTVLVTLLIRAQQPAALSTALLVTVGNMQSFRAACEIMLAIVVLTAIGEPIRRVRARQMERREAAA